MGYNVTVIRRTPYVNPDVDRETGVCDGVWRGVRLCDLSAPKVKGVEAWWHTLRGVIKARQLGADIIHIHAIGPALWAPLARFLGMKVVMTHHGPDYDRAKWGPLAKAVLMAGQWIGCTAANRVIVISDVIRGIVRSRCGRTLGVNLIYNGVPQPQPQHDAEYMRELGIAEGRYVLAMCRLVPEKRLHDLVEAFARLHDAGRIDTDIRLVLAGDTDIEDDYTRRLKRQAREHDVVLTGFVHGHRQQTLLTGAMAYALPSAHEGLPIALLEAMSYGLPVVTSAIPACLEVGLPPECYHPVGDVAALADRLEAVCRRAPRRAEYDMSRYDWDRIARQVAEVYDGI